jgi:cell fate regulator YaaT (PSP1 superfamily)
MKEEFVKEFHLEEKSDKEKEKELIMNIIRVKKELKIARVNFEYAQSEELVDYYIYQIKANQAKLSHLIKIAKTSGIAVNIPNEMKVLEG